MLKRPKIEAYWIRLYTLGKVPQKKIAIRSQLTGSPLLQSILISILGNLRIR